jgi:hypothetical protein
MPTATLMGLLVLYALLSQQDAWRAPVGHAIFVIKAMFWFQEHAKVRA